MARDSAGRFTAGIEIAVVDRTLAPLRRIVKGFDDVAKAGQRARDSKGRFIGGGGGGGADRASKQAAKWFDIGNLETLGREATAIIDAPIRKFTDFQKTMSEVRAKTFKGNLTGDAPAEFAELTAAARELGATTSFSASEAAGGMVNLATAGFTAKEQLASMAGVLDLAKAGNESIAESGEIGANVLRGFGLEAAEMGRVGDVLVNSFTSTNTTLVDLGETMKMVSTVAKNAGVSLETTAAAAGVLGDVGIKGSMAGTTLRAMLLRFQAPDRKGKSALAFLGINPKDKAGNLRPFEDMLAEIDKAMDRKFGEGKGGNRRAAVMKALFGEEPAAGAAALVDAAGSGKLQKLIAANNDAKGVSHKVALDMGDNTAGAAAELDSALEELQLTLGETLIPAFTDLLKWTQGVAIEFAAWAKENPELTRALGALAAALAVVATVTRVVTIAMMTNPIVAIVTGIALAAYLLYEHWEPVKAFFEENWKAITVAVGLFMPFLLPIIGAAKLVIDNWEPIRDFFTGLWDGVTSSFKTAMDWILKQIEWVGEAVEAFQVSVMSEEDAAAYAAQKAANSEAANASSALFADDLDTAGSLTKRGGLGDVGGAAWQDMNAANNTNYAVDQLANVLTVPEQYGPAAPSMSEWQALADARPMGPAMLGEAQAGDESRIFDGKLMITVNSEGQVTKTSMRSEGDPNFAVRMNAGGQ